MTLITYLSNSKFDGWKTVADTANKIGVIDELTKSEVARYIDISYNSSTSSGSLWFKGTAQQNRYYYLQTGPTLAKSNSTSVFDTSWNAWGFEETSGKFEDRTGRTNASKIGSLTYSVSGQISKSILLCNASGGKVVQTGLQNYLKNLQNITLALCLKIPSLGSFATDIINGIGGWLNVDNTSSSDSIIFSYNEDFSIVNIKVYSPSIIPRNVYSLVFFVFDGTKIVETDKIKIYINGLEILDNPVFDQNNGTHTNNITSGSIIGIDNANNLEIDEIRIFNSSLTQDEISWRNNQWMNQNNYWTVTVQPIISSVTNIGGKRWKIDGSGFKPESTDPTGTIAGIPFIIQGKVTDTSFIVSEGDGVPSGLVTLSLTNSDGETDYTSILSSTIRLKVDGDSPNNFIRMPNIGSTSPGSNRFQDTNKGNPQGDIPDNSAGANLADGTESGNTVRTVRGGGSSNLGMYSKPSWLH